MPSPFLNKFFSIFRRTNSPTVKKPEKKRILIDADVGNHITGADSDLIKGKISIRGAGNTISFSESTKFAGTITIVGSGNTIHFGRNTHIRGKILVKESKNQVVSFGNGTTTVDVYILCQENCSVEIGHACMFSREIEIRTTDAHSVIDLETGKRLNVPSSIKIGDHVWVGVGAIINKGSVIPSDTIVGAMAFVNQVFEETNTVIAGAPARVVKRGVTWNRSRKAQFDATERASWKAFLKE